MELHWEQEHPLVYSTADKNKVTECLWLQQDKVVKFGRKSWFSSGSREEKYWGCDPTSGCEEF
jgi:hypothetical protein